MHGARGITDGTEWRQETRRERLTMSRAHGRFTVPMRSARQSAASFVLLCWSSQHRSAQAKQSKAALGSLHWLWRRLSAPGLSALQPPAHPSQLEHSAQRSARSAPRSTHFLRVTAVDDSGRDRGTHLGNARVGYARLGVAPSDKCRPRRHQSAAAAAACASLLHHRITAHHRALTAVCDITLPRLRHESQIIAHAFVRAGHAGARVAGCNRPPRAQFPPSLYHTIYIASYTLEPFPLVIYLSLGAQYTPRPLCTTTAQSTAAADSPPIGPCGPCSQRASC